MSTHNIPLSICKKNQLKLSRICSYWIFFSKGLKDEFGTIVVNEPSMFESLKFYYTRKTHRYIGRLLFQMICYGMGSKVVWNSHALKLINTHSTSHL